MGIIVLAVFLLLYGLELLGVVSVGSTVLGVLALLAGILLLVKR